MQQAADHIAGFLMRGKRWSTEEKQEVPGKFFNLYLYETDKNGDPKVQTDSKGKPITKKLANGEEVPKYNIVKTIRIAESTMLKVATGASKRCLVYWTEPQSYRQ